jgi:hypothetical protein
MRAPRFVYVGLSFTGNPPPQANVPGVDAAVESESLDWMRFNWLTYILWTPSDCETIVRKIRRVPGMQTYSVIASDLNFEGAYGILPPWLWDWLNKHPEFAQFKDTPPE